MRKVIFLPWRSEFGTLLMYYVRYINSYSDVGYKIVCCRKGDEALFPSANEFYYHWEEPADIDKRNALLKSEDHLDYLAKLTKKLNQVFPDFEVIRPPNKQPILPKTDFTPKPLVLRDLCCDIVICPRYRKHGMHRNFKYWPEVANKLRSSGLVIASAGMEETSVYVEADYYTYEYDTLNATMEFMQNCRLTLSTDTGLAHLAVLVGSPLAVIYDQPGKEAGHPHWPWVFDYMKGYAKNYCEPILHGWNDPQLVVDFVLDYIG